MRRSVHGLELTFSDLDLGSEAMLDESAGPGFESALCMLVLSSISLLLAPRLGEALAAVGSDVVDLGASISAFASLSRVDRGT